MGCKTCKKDYVLVIDYLKIVFALTLLYLGIKTVYGIFSK